MHLDKEVMQSNQKSSDIGGASDYKHYKRGKPAIGAPSRQEWRYKWQSSIDENIETIRDHVKE